MPPETDSRPALPRPSFVLPLLSTVTGYSHSMEGSTLTVCVSASLAAQLFFDGADPWEFIQREAEMCRLYLPKERPDMTLERVAAPEIPHGMFGETVRVVCSWARVRKDGAA